jgi:hypothetical protein
LVKVLDIFFFSPFYFISIILDFRTHSLQNNNFLLFYLKNNNYYSFNCYLFCFESFLINFFSISSLNIRFFKNWVSWFFWLPFYGVILVSWFGSWIWKVSPGCFSLFFRSFLKIDFFLFCPLTLCWLGIKLCNFFLFLFYVVILVSWPRSLIWRVDSGFFSLFFLIDFFLFSPFNNALVES